MKIKTQKGITIIALIITIILMLILVGIGIEYGGDALKEAKLEDIKTDMISIKTKAKIVAEQYNFKDIEDLVGGNVTEEEIEKIQLKEKLQELKDDEYEIVKWNSDDLASQNLGTIEGEKYIVFYDLKDPNKCEVYYLEGYEGKYSLTELQGL